MTLREPICWGLLAPMSDAELRAQALQARRVVDEDESEDWPETWEVFGGTGGYSLLVDREAGAEDIYDAPLASHLSGATNAPVYVLHGLRDCEGAEQVIEYRGGSRRCLLVLRIDWRKTWARRFR